MEKTERHIPRGPRGKKFDAVFTWLLDNYVIGTLANVGADRATLTNIALDRGYDVTSFDIVKTKFITKDMKFVYTDLNKGELKDKGKFDYVFCIEVAEHLENPHLLFEQLKSIMKPDSKLIISVPNLESLYSRLYYLFKGRFPSFPDIYKKLEHVNPIGLNEIKLLAEKYNLKINAIWTEGTWIPGIRKYLGNYELFSTNLLFGISLVIIMEKRE